MAIESSIGTKVRKLNVDGPVAANNLLMQLQADLSGLSVCKFHFNSSLELEELKWFGKAKISVYFSLVPLVRTKIFDTTALGVALLAAHSIDVDVFNMQEKTYDKWNLN